MKQYLFILLAITLNQACLSMNGEHEESAYIKARQSYAKIIEKFGRQLVAHKIWPHKYQPFNRDELSNDLSKVLEQYCKKAYPELNVNDECAFKLAERINADKKIVPEAKNFLLSFLESNYLASKKK